jgi:hypothetical protein
VIPLERACANDDRELRIGRFRERVLAAVEDAVSKASEGQRNNTLAAQAFKLGRWWATGLVDEARSLKVLAKSNCEERHELAPRQLANGKAAGAFTAADFSNAPASAAIVEILNDGPGTAPSSTQPRRSAPKARDRVAEVVKREMANLRHRLLESRRSRRDRARAEQPPVVVVATPLAPLRLVPVRIPTNCYACVHCRRTAGPAARRFARRATHGDCRRLDGAHPPGPLAWLARAESCTDFTPIGAA